MSLDLLGIMIRGDIHMNNHPEGKKQLNKD
jgi:hypothetical protein